MRARFAVGHDLMQDLLIDQRLIIRIGQRVGRAVHSLRAVTSGAVLAVERSKVQHRIGTRHLWTRLGAAWQAGRSQARRCDT